MRSCDLLIVGAGPAGMAAAIAARQHELDVIVLDEQPTPGGQIWRSVEMAHRRDDILGPSFAEGRSVAEEFRASGVTYLPDARIWRIEPGFLAYFTRGEKVDVIKARCLILSTGAQERPVPFPGWTLPGVLTVGAAQILLKNAGQIPTGETWIAGSGPLPLLYVVQLLRAGGRVAGYLDTTPPGQWRSAIRHLPRALRAMGDIAKGLEWTAMLRRSGTLVAKGASDIEALGEHQIEAVRYRTRDGKEQMLPANTLLVHEGIVPNVHAPLSMDCQISWNDAQDCFRPVLDTWCESSVPGLFVAGDGAGIAGANAAQLRGALATLRVATQLGRVSEDRARNAARAIHRKLDRELAVRPFLDALFKPRAQVFTPEARTIVCRCEEVTAAEIVGFANIGRPGPSQVKTATRAGMGPCQGRQCGYSVTCLLAAAQGRTPSEVGFFHVRPPLKPVTIGELASMDRSSSAAFETSATSE